MKNNQHIAELLLSMDAAEQSPAPDPDRREKDLRQVLETNPSVSVLPAVARLGRRWKTLALAGSTVAATAALIIVPALSGGDPAFATWTAAPGQLSGTERDNAVSDCLRSRESVGGGMYADDLAAADVAIAERRGAWTTVVLTGADGFEATCTTDASAPWFNKGSFGSIGKPFPGESLSARGVRATELGTGVISNKPLSMAAGRVGADVTAIVYTSAAGKRIEATVSKGQFAFWLPGAEITNSSDQRVPIEVTFVDNSKETLYLSL